MKKVVFISMILLLISSWYFVIANNNKKNDDYNVYIEKANKCLQKEIYVDAIDYYKKAINLYPNKLEDKIKLAIIYKQAKMFNSFENYCKSLVDQYENNEQIIVMLGDYYVEIGKGKKAIAWYRDNLIKNKDSKLVSQKLSDLKSEFTIEYNNYSDISVFHNNYAVFEKNNKYGVVDASGNIVITATYDSIGVFDNNKEMILAPALADGEFFYIDKDGNKRLASDEIYEYLGSFSINELAAYKRNNEFGYIDKDFTESETKYEFASSFSDNGVAAVKQNNKWLLIDESFKAISDICYDDIKIDELGYAVHSNIIYAKKDGKYLILDTKGKEITNPIYDDVDFFNTLNEPAAVKFNGKWGFVDAIGNLVIDYKYENAFSFSCGLAPVLIDGNWGYIDIEDNIVIKPQFKMAKSFSSCGVAPVFKSEWQLITLEYYK